MTRINRPRARTKVALALTGCALVASMVSATHAAYQDRILLNAGAQAAVGNPVEFEVQVQDPAGAWQNADTEEESVARFALPDATVSTARVTEVVVPFRLQPGSPAGDVLPSLITRSGCDDRCAALFDRMLFTVLYDGVPVASGVSAAEFNAIDERQFSAAQPGDEHSLTLQFSLHPDTPFMWSGSTTELAVSLVGSSS